MFDVFYFGRKPGVFAHEQPAVNLADASVKSRTRFFWIVNYLSDYEGFDFLWEPVPWEAAQRHVWPSQWQVDGGTQLVPTAGFTDTNYHSGIVKRRPDSEIVYIDHGNQNPPTTNFIQKFRYVDNYLDTLKRIANAVESEHVWITSSICDYTDFDFSWHPEPWQSDMIHVFASGQQRFGDTFYMHVPSARKRLHEVELLDWYSLNFVNDISVPRHHIPVNWHQRDTHVDAIQQHEFQAPLEIFTCTNVDVPLPEVNLWRGKTKTIVPLSAGASAVIVPQAAVPLIKTQLYDYPYIGKSHNNLVEDRLQDVIFISNGEPMAEDNWKNLVELCPRARRSDGVTGREAAYKAAAAMSETPWFFAVFAKTEVLPTFKFDFQPDRMQQPKHYIFHSRNPVNGLEYGAMNINLYNRQLTLDTRPGLDFTLSSAHEVVPIVASISRFNTDPWVSWRSAFREVLKLKREVDFGADVEIQYRLDTWCNHAEGENAEWVLQGARDALEYYVEVNGRLEKLQLSFDWAWLKQWFESRHGYQLWTKTDQQISVTETNLDIAQLLIQGIL
jgi:hypothetical protein